jgi:Transposase IS66 family
MRLKSSGRLFADETTVPVLDPGHGRTKTGQLWEALRVAGVYGKRPEIYRSGRIVVAVAATRRWGRIRGEDRRRQSVQFEHAGRSRSPHRGLPRDWHGSFHNARLRACLIGCINHVITPRDDSPSRLLCVEISAVSASGENNREQNHERHN